jgi:glyoxylase-like metal-dependent hydrolase (beta-lactamase superfamily II)
MIEEVYANIYRSEIPLPRNPLKSLNSYVIKGDDRNLIIDTGFNVTEAREAFFSNLEALEVDPGKADVIVTHLHSDHSGLAYDLSLMGAKLFMSQGDGSAVNRIHQHRAWRSTTDRMRMYGLVLNDEHMNSHPGKAYAPGGTFDFTVLAEDDVITIGNYQLTVVSVPGHTPDMINLYERNHQVYFSGDHVLDPITPNITYWGEEYPVILQQYLDSLKKIYTYPIKLMLPAHRALIHDHPRRIDELLEHHALRMNEILGILSHSGQPMTVAEIASQMTWKIRADNWDAFPVAQKIFAVGEAMSHLDLIVHKQWAVMNDVNGVLHFASQANELLD